MTSRFAVAAAHTPAQVAAGLAPFDVAVGAPLEPVSFMPPVLDALELYVSGLWPLGWGVPTAPTKNRLSYEQATAEHVLAYGPAFQSTQVRTDADSYQGGWCVELTATGADPIAAPGIVPCTAGVPIHVQAMIKSLTIDRNFTVGANWIDASGAEMNQASGALTPVVAGTWTRVVADLTPPAGAVAFKMTVWGRSFQTGAKFRVDCCGAWGGGSTEWVAPGVSDSSPLAAWADLSGTLGPVNLLTTNQATIETDTTGWDNGTVDKATLARVTSEHREGNAALALTCIADGTMSAYLRPDPPATPGTTYTGLLSVKGSPSLAGKEGRLYLQYYSASGWVGEFSIGFTYTADWQDLSLRGLCPVGAIKARLNPWAVGAVVGDVAYFDRASIAEGLSTEWAAPAAGAHTPRDAVMATTNQQPAYRDASTNMLTYAATTCEGISSGDLHSDWQNQIPAVMTVDVVMDITPVQGRKTLKFTSTADAATTSSVIPVTSQDQQQFVPVVPGQTVTAIGHFQPGANYVGSIMSIKVLWYNANKEYIGEQGGNTASNLPAGVWTKHRNVAVAPAGAAYGSPQVVIRGMDQAGRVMYLDALGLFYGDVSDWTPAVILPAGKPAVQFGSAIGVRLAALLSLPRPCTLYLVATPLLDQAAQDPPLMATRVPAAGLFAATHVSDYGYAGDSQWLDPAGNPPVGAPRIVSFVHDTPPALSAVAETATGYPRTESSKAAGNSQMDVGPMEFGSTAGSASYLGVISCALAYSGAHTPAQVAQIEAWLGDLYGISVAP